jgi:hypothetical protein
LNSNWSGVRFLDSWALSRLDRVMLRMAPDNLVVSQRLSPPILQSFGCAW